MAVLTLEASDIWSLSRPSSVWCCKFCTFSGELDVGLVFGAFPLFYVFESLLLRQDGFLARFTDVEKSNSGEGVQECNSMVIPLVELLSSFPN